MNSSEEIKASISREYADIEQQVKRVQIKIQWESQ